LTNGKIGNPKIQKITRIASWIYPIKKQAIINV